MLKYLTEGRLNLLNLPHRVAMLSWYKLLLDDVQMSSCDDLLMTKDVISFRGAR